MLFSAKGADDAGPNLKSIVRWSQCAEQAVLLVDQAGGEVQDLRTGFQAAAEDQGPQRAETDFLPIRVLHKFNELARLKFPCGDLSVPEVPYQYVIAELPEVVRRQDNAPRRIELV